MYDQAFLILPLPRKYLQTQPPPPPFPRAHTHTYKNLATLRSLCKAAAVTTVVRLFIQAMRCLPRVCRCCNFLLELLRGVLDYVLTYVICFISIYGLSFSEGGCGPFSKLVGNASA